MEHNVKSYQRRLKNGKTITVRAYTRKGKDGRNKNRRKKEMPTTILRLPKMK